MADFKYGPRSEENFKGVHPSLVALFREAIKYRDISIIDGVRTIEEQRRFVAKGDSKTMNSMHLPQEDGLSHAIDATPYPFDWNAVGADRDLLLFGGFILGLAATLGLKIRYGGDWNGNWKNSDNGFQDLDHFEIHL